MQVIKELFVVCVLCAIMQTQQMAQAQLIRWSYYGQMCTSCTPRDKGPEKSEPAPVIQDTPAPDQTTGAAPEKAEGPARLFDQNSDDLEELFDLVCKTRHINAEALKQKQLKHGAIRYTESAGGSYAGCTWGGSGYVTRLDIVPGNCYSKQAVQLHELGHVVTFLTQERASLFCHEGASQILEPQSQREKMAHLYAAPRDFLDFVECQSYGGDLRVYSYSVAVFEYLRRVGGRWWLESFMREASQTGNFERALRRWYGLDADTFNHNVKQFLSTGKVKKIC